MKYRRKPVVVDAEQFDPDKNPWPAGVKAIHPHWSTSRNLGDNVPLRYNFLSGSIASPILIGDWVVTNPDGARYVVSLLDFFDWYERVSTAHNA